MGRLILAEVPEPGNPIWQLNRDISIMLCPDFRYELSRV